MQEGDLSPKVTPLLCSPQQSRQFCDTVGELTMVLRLFSQMFRLSKSRHRITTTIFNLNNINMLKQRHKRF